MAQGVDLEAIEVIAGNHGLLERMASRAIDAGLRGKPMGRFGGFGFCDTAIIVTNESGMIFGRAEEHLLRPACWRCSA